MINIEYERIKTKLKLWETQGFFQFVEDLAEYIGPEMDIRKHVDTVKTMYLHKKREMENEKGFLKQGTLKL